jgi:hypothetical protein
MLTSHRRRSLPATLMLLTALLTNDVTSLAQTPEVSPHSPAVQAEASPAADLLDAAIRPEQQDDIANAVPDGLPIYEIAATLDHQESRSEVPVVSGQLRLNFTNLTGEPLAALPFRLYANGPDAENDALTVSDVLVHGQAVEPALSVDDSVLSVPFAEPLAADATAEISMAFTTELPVDSRNHYGILGVDSRTGTWAMAHWYPIVAGRDPDRGWVLDPPSENGDPIFSTTALYDVSLTAEEDWRLVTTGIETKASAVESDGMTTRQYLSGPVRDFTVVADADLDVATREINGITINSWFQPGQDRVGDAVLTYAAQSVNVLEPLLGPYPYRELDLVGIELSGAAGVEFPQLIYIGAGYYTDRQPLDAPNSLDFTVAHEVIHQWFYNLVGNNQYDSAYIDEGLTNYLTAGVYVQRQYSDAAAREAIERYLAGPFENAVEAGNDPVVDQPTDDFPTGNAYVLAAYSKAPLGFQAIREQIGDEAFFAALQSYVEEFRFGVATPEDLKAAFEAASGENLDALWTHWFERAEGERDIAP